jgi:hypothetical protein
MINFDFNLDIGLVIFFLGLITFSLRKMRKDISCLKKIALKNHPEDFI